MPHTPSRFNFVIRVLVILYGDIIVKAAPELQSVVLTVPTKVLFVGEPAQLVCTAVPPDIEFRTVRYSILQDKSPELRYNFVGSRPDEGDMRASWVGRAVGWEKDGSVYVNLSRVTLDDDGLVRCVVSDVQANFITEEKQMNVVVPPSNHYIEYATKKYMDCGSDDKLFIHVDTTDLSSTISLSCWSESWPNATHRWSSTIAYESLTPVKCVIDNSLSICFTAITFKMASIYASSDDIPVSCTASSFADDVRDDSIACITLTRGPCRSNPCLNAGTCQTIDDNLYKCICQKNYYGVNCEISGCNSGACYCQNEGLCRDRLHDCYCDCTDCRTGVHCEKFRDANPCVSVTDFCFNGGSCIQTCQGAICKCAINWNGTLCKTRCDLMSTAANQYSTSVTLGNSHKLVCHGSAISFSWYVNDDIATSLPVAYGPILPISVVHAANRTFYCVANSAMCSQIATYTVTVKNTWELVGSPDITNTTVLKPGESLHIDCGVSGSPKPDVVWERLNSSNVTRLQNATKQTAKLSLERVTVADSATYMCIAMYLDVTRKMMAIDVLVVATGPLTSDHEPMALWKIIVIVLVACWVLGLIMLAIVVLLFKSKIDNKGSSTMIGLVTSVRSLCVIGFFLVLVLPVIGVVILLAVYLTSVKGVVGASDRNAEQSRPTNRQSSKSAMVTMATNMVDANDVSTHHQPSSLIHDDIRGRRRPLSPLDRNTVQPIGEETNEESSRHKKRKKRHHRKRKKQDPDDDVQSPL